MIRKLYFFIIAMAFTFSAVGQGYFSFYQLRELVPQTQSLQPAFIPNNSFTFGLPGLGVSTEADFVLQDLLSKPDGSLDFNVDFDVLLDATNPMNRTNLDVTGNLFYIGIKTKNGGYSLFANARVTLDTQYGSDLIEFLANGNANRIGQEISLANTRANFNAYHEIGIGHTRKFLNERLIIGGRVKRVTGVYHASLAEGATGSIMTDANDYSWTVNVQNGTANTAGFDFHFNSSRYPGNELEDYAISNGNTGIAFDVGAIFKPFKWLTIEGSVNDIGSIDWTEQVRNYNTQDTEVTFSGVQLRGLENSDEVFRDSVESKFISNETRRAFTTDLTMRSYLAASLNAGKYNRFTFMAFNNHAFDEIDPSFAVSYNRSAKYFTFGVVGSYRNSHTEVNLGANIAADIGPVQLYLALDNAVIMNKPETYSKADIRFGFNLMFGYKKWRDKTEVVNLDEL